MSGTIFMIWYDSDPKKTLGEKIGEGAEYFLGKYGKPATICLAHPDDLTGAKDSEAGIRVESDRRVMRKHIWIAAHE